MKSFFMLLIKAKETFNIALTKEFALLSFYKDVIVVLA